VDHAQLPEGGSGLVNDRSPRATLDTVLSAPLRAFRFIGRQNVWMVGLLPLMLGAYLMVEAFDPRVYNGGDNALYWALGKSLAETGEYRDLGAPGQPRETSIPWGFPALLAIGMKMLPDGTEPEAYTHLKAIPWFAMVGGLVCLWLLLQHLLRDNRTLALLVMLLCVVNYRLIVYAALILTEAPYLLLSMGCLLSFEWYRHRAPTRWWGILPAATLATYAYLVRPAGVALVVALVGYLALSRRWTALAVSLLVVAALAGTWHARCMVTPSEAENLYLSHLVKQSKWQSGEEKVDAGGFLHRLAINAHHYARRPLTQITLGRKWKEEHLHVAALVMLPLIALGYVLTLTRAGPLHLYLPLYLFVLIAWLPESVKDRYLVMVYPLLLAFAAHAVWWLVSLIWPRLAPAVVLVLAVVLFWPQLTLTLGKIERCEVIQDKFDRGYDQKYRRRSYRSYVKICGWLKKHAERDTVLGARKPRLAYYYSGHQAVRTTYASDPDEVFDWLVAEEVDYLVLDHIDGRVMPTRERLRPTLQAYPEHFSKVYETSIHDSVWRFHAEVSEPPPATDSHSKKRLPPDFRMPTVQDPHAAQ